MHPSTTTPLPGPTCPLPGPIPHTPARSIWAFPNNDTSCSILLAATGQGAELIERCSVRDNHSSSGANGSGDNTTTSSSSGGDNGGGNGSSSSSGGGLAAPCSVTVLDAAYPEEQVHTDFRVLHLDTGLRSFSQVLIGTPAAPLGVLLVGKQQPGELTGDW